MKKDSIKDESKKLNLDELEEVAGGQSYVLIEKPYDKNKVVRIPRVWIPEESYKEEYGPILGRKETRI